MNSTNNGLAHRRIVICGSMAFHGRMLDQKRRLTEAGIETITPDADPRVIQMVQVEDWRQLKRKASMRHIRRVRDQKTFGILVMNLDKYGIHDYIGPNTFAEIAIAFAHYKQIYLFQNIPAFYQDELIAWGVVALNGRLSHLVNAFQRAALVEIMQPRLF